MSSNPETSHGWVVRSLIWFGQTVLVASLLFMAVAVAGIGLDFPPDLLFLASAALAGPPLLLRQASLLLDDRVPPAK